MSNTTHKKTVHPQHFIALGVVILLVIAVLLLKDSSKPEAAASTGVLPEQQLEMAVRAGRPALAFFHSNTCDQCLQMIETVEEVFPEFVDSVDLVDVNVYELEKRAPAGSRRRGIYPHACFLRPVRTVSKVRRRDGSWRSAPAFERTARSAVKCLST